MGDFCGIYIVNAGSTSGAHGAIVDPVRRDQHVDSMCKWNESVFHGAVSLKDVQLVSGNNWTRLREDVPKCLYNLLKTNKLTAQMDGLSIDVFAR